ncbi:MAG: T9SS type A sorting domain-containing protein [Bacteroidia bacterium]
MNKNYFLLLFLSICFFCNAQVKMYEYPTQVLTEDGIDKLVEQSMQNKTPDAELKRFRELLYLKMNKQRSAAMKGITEKSGHVLINSVGCPNAGFQNGTNSNWTFASADINGVNLPCNACPTGSVAINATVNSVSTITGQCINGMDIYGNFPVVAPGGGAYSLLLNDANYMGKMEETKYSFVVDSSFNIYSMQYAAVLNSGGHPATVQSYFSVFMIDNTTGSTIPCTQYLVSAPTSGSLPGWNISSTCGGNACNTVYYKPWTTSLIDLSSIVGHTVTITYIVSDCNNGGHFGYAYLDGDCSFLSHTNTSYMCSGQNAYLCGPVGYDTYHWTGPVSDSSQCISAGTAGVYTLNLTENSGCIPPQLTYTVSASSLTPPLITITGEDTVCFSFKDSLTAGGASSYAWTNGITNGVPFTPTATANYIVTATDTNGCSNTDSITVFVDYNCTTGIKNTSIASVKLYPNPANNIVTFQSEEKPGSILIYNSMGEMALQTNSQNTKTEIDISKLSKGIYTVKVQNRYLRLVKE